MIQESKETRFKRVAERRTKTALHVLRLIGNCGNKGNYSYTPEQVRKIFWEIEKATKEARSKFYLPKNKEFKL